VRDGHHRSVGGISFREFLERGLGEDRATLADWNVHLTTLFPENRLKRILEVRGADAVPPGMVCALPAFWKGLFYDEISLGSAGERLAHWTFEQVDALHLAVARGGLDAKSPDGPVLEVARELVDLAAAGLGRIDARNRAGEDERLFLEPLYEILERGSSPGRYLLERWDGAWEGRVELLIEYAKY
jgi:glutamate--cysteine ligase